MWEKVQLVSDQFRSKTINEADCVIMFVFFLLGIFMCKFFIGNKIQKAQLDILMEKVHGQRMQFEIA